MPKHELTPEERLRGPANRRAKREAREEKAAEELSKALERAVTVLAEAMYAESFAIGEEGVVGLGPAHTTRVRAAAQVLDRVLGRATQRTELLGAGGGPIVLEHDVSGSDAAAILRGLAERGLIRPGVASNGDAPAD